MPVHPVVSVQPAFRLVLLVLVLASLVLLPAGAGATGPLPPVDATVEPSHSLGADVPGAPSLPLGQQSAGAPDAATAALKWYSVAGAGFIPYSSAMTWSYGGSGCIQPTAAGYWRASVNLVDASVAKMLVIGYFNSSNSTATTGQLYKYDGLTGAYIEIARLTTLPGADGQGFRNLAIPINETIDNTWNSYMFAWSGAAPATAQQLCFMRVGYTPPPLWGTFMPTLTR